MRVKTIANTQNHSLNSVLNTVNNDKRAYKKKSPNPIQSRKQRVEKALLALLVIDVDFNRNH